MTEGDPVIVVGGVIGGFAAALARRGLAVKVLSSRPRSARSAPACSSGRTPSPPSRFHDALEWLYGWRVENGLAQ